MTPTAREDYLATEVLTAAPQKLQLLLIEGAMRLAQQARTLWQARRNEEAGESLVRCQQIVTELLCGLRPEKDAKLVSNVGHVYLFIFRTLVAAHLEHSEQKLNEAISLLEIERETWRQVCQKLGARLAVDNPSDQGPTHRAAFVA